MSPPYNKLHDASTRGYTHKNFTLDTPAKCYLQTTMWEEDPKIQARCDTHKSVNNPDTAQTSSHGSHCCSETLTTLRGLSTDNKALWNTVVQVNFSGISHGLAACITGRWKILKITKTYSCSHVAANKKSWPAVMIMFFRSNAARWTKIVHNTRSKPLGIEGFKKARPICRDAYGQSTNLCRRACLRNGPFRTLGLLSRSYFNSAPSVF